MHWIGVAVRESVINAIKHGNREDYGKLVTVEFALAPAGDPERARRAGPRPGRGLRSRGSRRSPGAREHPQIERPRHLLHAQLHGRRDPSARRPKGAWKCAWSRSWRPVPDPHPAALSRHRHRSGDPRRRDAAGAVRHRHPRRQEGRDRPGHRDRPADRARVPRDDRRAVSRPRRARRGVRDSAAIARPTPPILLGLRSGRRHDQLRARPADLLLVAGARDRRRDRGRRGLRPDAPRAVHGRARPGRVAERRGRCACRRPTR